MLVSDLFWQKETRNWQWQQRLWQRSCSLVENGPYWLNTVNSTIVVELVIIHVLHFILKADDVKTDIRL